MQRDEYLTIQDAARELGVTVGAIYTALYEGRLLFDVKYGRKVISRADLEEYRQRTRPNGVKPVGRPKHSI